MTRTQSSAPAGAIHREPHPLAGRTVTLNDHTLGDGEVEPGITYHIEDYWDRVSGGSWTVAEGNPAALKYALRTGIGSIKHGRSVPMNDEVVYGKVGQYGHLVHVDELGDPVGGDA